MNYSTNKYSNNKSTGFIICILLLLCFLSCKFKDRPITNTITDEEKTGLLRYYTNDPQYKNETIIIHDTKNAEIDYRRGLSLKSNKLSGSKKGFFGLSFCKDVKGFYAVLIDINQNYKVYQVIDNGTKKKWC